ncbi:MAG: amino acid adenylation domain-containing protein [Verrucomicrobiales bacterium]|nr:amino acid adenylation domain-containing protein [Verrucomicrobiales bacterium]
MSQADQPTREPLAIIGIGCRLPGGVTGPDSFWNLLIEGKSGIREVPEDRWNRERWYHENVEIPSKMITKWGGFIDGHDQFDAQFFGISPREALRMDPQQRWLLETAYESLEDAGIPAPSLKGKDVGVFVGIASNDYANVAQSDPKNVDVHTNSGSTLSIASNRIAYLMDFRGPAVSVDTACSSALVAINLACESIWTGSSEMALAGGVNALLTPDASIGFSKATMLSPTGQCFAFDDRANGYVRGEGAGMFAIKPLSKAQADGDRIYCTIKAAVINQDGNTSSMTVPGVETQAEMLRIAYDQAGMEPKRVRYMEAHGTGTPVGDPIETRALGMVLSDGRDEDDTCLIGSVKTNVGHLESGSGVAGVLKAALVLYHDTVPKNLNFKNPNPNIPFDEFKLEVVTENQPIPRLGDFPAVAAVNSFGFGGTNSHIVLEEAPGSNGQSPGKPKQPGKKKADRPVMLPISARTDEGLREMAARYRRFLRENNEDLLEDIAANAGKHREHMESRLTVLGRNRDEICHELTEWLALNPGENVIAGKPGGEVNPLVFVFTGQGAQWWKMGQELIEREPVFRGVLEEIDTHLKPMAGWSLIDEMTKDEEFSQINRTNIAQPAIFGLQVALAELWKSWGIEPSKVVGHSVGEVAAAYVAGIYTMEDAVKVIYHRSRLQDQTGGNGKMVAVGLSASEAKKAIGEHADKVQVAVINSPGMVTIAGDTEPLKKVIEPLEEAGKFVRWLRIDYAFHTHQMEPIKTELLEVLKDIKPMASKIPYISTVTGGICEGTKVDAEYWWQNVREAVLFSPAITGLIRSGEDSFLELGPHPALQNPIMECLSEQSRKGVYFSSLTRKTDESIMMLTNLAKMQQHGYEIDWDAVNQADGKFVDLPNYTWQHETFWLESEEGEYLRCADFEHPLLGLRQTAPKPTWRFECDPRYFTWLDDHRFWDSVVFPASGYGEIGLAVARKMFPGENYVVEELEMKKALFVSETNVPTVEVVFDSDTRVFQIFSSTSTRKEWELNSQGVLRKQPVPVQEKPMDFELLKKGLDDHFTHGEYYDDYEEAGYQFQPLFRHLQEVWRKPGESFAEILTPEGLLDSVPEFHVHPAVLDAYFHVVKGGQKPPEGAKATDYFYLPAAISSIRLYQDRPPRRVFGHAKVDTSNEREHLSADIDLYDEEGILIAQVFGFRADRVEQGESDDLEKATYQASWEIARLKGTRVKGSAGLPDPDKIVAAANEVMPALYEERQLNEHYEKFMPLIDQASRQFIVNAYFNLGWQPQVGDKVEVREHVRELDIADQHERLVYGQLTALEEGGWLRKAGEETWEVISVPEETCAEELLDQLEEELPRFASEVELQRQAGPNLAGVLTGTYDPIEVLFPGGSSDMMERFYREGADFPVLNGQVLAALERAVADLPERRAIRVLEIGAGTGSLTQRILPAFPADRTEYLFTDTGPLFVANAKDKFGEQYPFVEYAMFDVEKDPVDQGIEPHNYDIIIASNVIHATADLKQTLNVVRRCLAPDGLFMFVEVTWRRAPLDNVFGLLPGWWRFTDTDLRERSALLSRSRWESLLTECDYRDVTSFISSPKPEEDQEACLIARAPEPVEIPVEEPVDEEQLVESESPADEEKPKLEVYLVMSDYSGVGKALETTLEERGVKVILTGGYAAEVEERIEELESDGDVTRVIVHALSLDHPRTDKLDAETLNRAQDTGVRSVHNLVKMITAREWDSKPKLFFLTRGTMPVMEADELPGLASAPITGILRVANNEFQDFQWTQVDLDPDGSEYELQDLADEILMSDRELEVAFRGDHRYARRVHRVKTEDLPPLTTNAVLENGEVLPYRLQIDKPGILTNLSLNLTTRRDPDPDEIEIQIKAGGINFRDVMKALGMYPGNPVDLKWFGDDFSGEVVRVGKNVKDLKPGDNVVGMAPYCFRSYVTVHRNLVFRKPDTMSHADAATLPTVFLTTHYAINELARMRKGERILIHAGTGGVGQAAIQIAQHLGLEIFSTAGSPEKRQMLRDQGVDHVLDSRSLEFADRIMEITNGEGVDAVLNSLAGDFIPKNFSVLRTFGRYLEIGKVDVYGNSKIGLEPLRNNISLFIIDLAQHLQDKPDYIAEMFSDLEKMFYAETYQPLPNKTFPITDVVDAFRYMAAGKHVGKNVLDFDVPEIQVGPATEEGHKFNPEGTYLITGGAGGFGLELAGWMAQNGARHFALMSRSGPKDDALDKIAALQKMGSSVMDARGDVTKREDIDQIVAEIQKTDAKLIGVIHGAMVLDDEFIVELDEERFDNVLLPKMLGAWHLHQATLGIPLEHFISFSSFSAVIGAVKQSNYNAGNCFLDQLSYYRRSQGLPALTFNWGALTGAGFVDRNEKTKEYLQLVGLGSTDMDETLELFSRGIPTDAVQLGCARVDWAALGRFSPSVGQSEMFKYVVPRSGGSGGESMAARILEAPADKRMGMVEDVIAQQVGAVLGTDSGRIDKDTPLTNLGLDSLMAIELVNRIEDKMGMSMPMGSVLNGPNIRDLATPVLEKLLESGGGEAAGAGDGSIEYVEFEATGEMPARFPLSEGQRALWFLNRFAPDSSAYNLIFSGKFTPLLDIDAMKRAFSLLFERHPELDVTFTTENGEPVQVMQTGRTVDFREHDCTKLNDTELKKLISDHANRPFDLERGPVVRLELFRTADNAHVALFSMHHIVSDAWSVAVLMQDLIEYYFSMKSGRTPQVEHLPASYADFVNWETAHLESTAGEAMFDYWKDSLEGAPLTLDLPTDRPRPAVQTFSGATHGFQLDDELTEAITDLSKAHSATLFTTTLSAFEILMHRYCQQDDLVVGVPLAGRSQSEVQNLVGYFINPVPVRSTIEDDPTIADYLERNRDQVNGAIENQQYPLAKMVDRLQVPRDPGRSPMFQVSFSMERIPGLDEQGIAVFLIGQGGHKFHVGDLTMETIDLTTRQAQFEITLVVEEAGGHLFGCWQYNRDLFEAETIAELSGLYEQVLRGMVDNPGAKISEINLLSDKEAEEILVNRNATTAAYPSDKLLHELVAEVAGANDETAAILCGDDRISYGSLNRHANGIAKKLIAEGVKVGDNVGVLVNRSPEMVAALLGVLKAGATYVPLDPEFPAERLTQMLHDAAPKAVLCSADCKDTTSAEWHTFDVATIEPTADPPAVSGVTPDSLAYIIYTSGSTGTPKGVEISHKAAVNFLTSMQNEPGFTAKDRLLAVTTLSFDISLLEMFLPLITGAKVVIADKQDVKDGRRLANLLNEEDVTVMQATPATWQMLLDSGWEGKSDLRIFCGGEALKRDLANVLVNSAKEVWNLYGPTETTVWSTIEQVTESDDNITVGKPIQNTQVYILDANRNPVPDGFTGELWIGGDGLARGYRNRPDLTNEAFQEIELPIHEPTGSVHQTDPIDSNSGDSADEIVGRVSRPVTSTPDQSPTAKAPATKPIRLYRTGDLARWNRDGVLECLGRVDFQVKVRGVRIELGDIEAQLAHHPQISQAVVTKREDLPSGEGLVAYLITNTGETPELTELRSFLAEKLPASYIPAHFQAVDDFPLTPNKKIDRKRLPAPNFGGGRGTATGEKVDPRTPTEQKLWDIFHHQFEREDFGITDNFFEMGGDSLLALRIVVETSEAFNREVPVDAFLRYPSIEQLAKYLETVDETDSLAAGEDAEELSLDHLDHIEVRFAGGDLPQVDAVALTYVPEILTSFAGVPRDEIAERWFAGKPTLTNVYELPQGKIGVIMLPRFEVDFYKDPDGVKQPILDSLELAAKIGAKTVSLTGVIPSATDHGRDIVGWIEEAGDSSKFPAITTGDATRAATVVRSVEGALEKSGRDMEGEILAAVGLGSIGLGTLNLTLDVLPHPKRLILCDPYQNEEQMARIRDEVRAGGYQGEIDVVANGGALPPEVFQASFIVASTNLPGVLDIGSLKPGTIVVDYSFPPIFRPAEAIRRFASKQDILFTTGGELSIGATVPETVYLPENADEMASTDGSLENGILRFLAARDKTEMTGCVLVSLLTGRKKGVESTLGPLSSKDAKAHYEYLCEIGYAPARAQMHGFFLGEADLEKFRSVEWSEV